MTRSFVRSSLYMAAGLLVWAADFLVTYSFAAVACARTFAQVSVFGVGIVPFVVALATVLASSATVVIGVRACRELRTLSSSEGSNGPERLESFVALTAAALGLVAILWNGAAALLVPGCNG